jgi:hypothetical protein
MNSTNIFSSEYNFNMRVEAIERQVYSQNSERQYGISPASELLRATRTVSFYSNMLERLKCGESSVGEQMAALQVSPSLYISRR